MGKLKYVHVVNKITPSMKDCLEEIPRRGGMYNWIFLFKGSMIPFNNVTKKILEQFDVVQLNMAPVDQFLVKEVRRMIGNNSNTLIIGNNDYTCESWDTWSQHPLQYEQAQDELDAVFGTEPHQTSHLREDAYTIPHPHWIDMLKHIGNDDINIDKFNVGSIYHWWEGKHYTQSLTFLRLRRNYPNLVTRLYGYNGANDKNKKWQKVMWDKTMPLMEYPEFQRSLMTNRFIYDNCSYHTYGRTTVDCSALRIPCLGSDRIDSMKLCFPEMCCDPFDMRKQLEIMDKVLKGGKWFDKQMDYAYESSEYYNYHNSEKRYMIMVEETRERLHK